jgi:hypothetical protein
MNEATTGRRNAEGQLQEIIQEYTGHYQKTQDERSKLLAQWESFSRWCEAYLAEYRLAYLYWNGRTEKRFVVPKLVKALPIALILAYLLFFAGCKTVEAESSFNLLLLCDRSSSASEFSCTAETIQKAGALWIKRADEEGGGIFEAYLIDNGFDSTTLIFSISYPNRFPSPVTRNKKAWKDDFFRRLSEETKKLPTSRGSGIVEAIYRASLRIPDKEKTLFYIASDMREVNALFNFEKKVLSLQEFRQWLESKRIRPKFRDSTQIIICGLHPYTPSDTSRMTTENYERLLHLWLGVFEKWGLKPQISETCNFKY